MQSDGSYTLDTTNAAYQNLAEGVTRDVVVDYIVTDPTGANDTAQLTITVTGVNDA
ncbi:VCBS domain-containing protein, partial [Methylobacterium sp. Leaf85]|uniref:VCBS domain-containing protein n=1 Tax=Methylobacterium sp. Leaf85 TaxID=1736241 RepID=UPI003FCE7747